jgi:hypothetical protein
MQFTRENGAVIYVGGLFNTYFPVQRNGISCCGGFSCETSKYAGGCATSGFAFVTVVNNFPALEVIVTSGVVYFRRVPPGFPSHPFQLQSTTYYLATSINFCAWRDCAGKSTLHKGGECRARTHPQAGKGGRGREGRGERRASADEPGGHR